MANSHTFVNFCGSKWSSAAARTCRTKFDGPRGGLLTAFACLMLLANCAAPVTEEPPSGANSEDVLAASEPSSPSDFSFPDQIVWDYFCYTPAGTQDLPHLDPTDFMISPDGTAAYSLQAGPETIEREYGRFLIVSNMRPAAETGRRGCEHHIVVTIDTENPETIEIQSVENWREIAGSEAVDAFESLQAECEALPPDEAAIMFADPGIYFPNRVVVTAPENFRGCMHAIASVAYSFLISGLDNEFVVSGIFGYMFIEEVVR